MCRFATHPNLMAFLDMLAHSEIGPALLAHSDDGYNVQVGGKLFADYSKHPKTVITVIIKGKVVKSSAAGRYQLLSKYYDAYRKSLKLNDFSPVSQDQIALQQIKEQGAIRNIKEGNIITAIDKCKNIWASLPGAGYGQHENDLNQLLKVYQQAGGTLAKDSV